jgi:hypothetical protein
MKRFLILLSLLAAALPAAAQSIWINTPIHTNNQFNRALPMQTWQCSAPQLGLGTHEVSFLDTDGTETGYVDCHGAIHGASIAPGGPNGSIQYNAGGAFGGIPDSTVNATTGDIGVTGITAPGAGSPNAIGAVTYVPTGSPGLNDMTTSGAYTCKYLSDKFYVTIVNTGTPDMFLWSDTLLNYNGTAETITGAPQTLDCGVSVTFAASTGHTEGDTWTFNVSYDQTVPPFSIPGYFTLNVDGSVDALLNVHTPSNVGSAIFAWGSSDGSPAIQSFTQDSDTVITGAVVTTLYYSSTTGNGGQAVAEAPFVDLYGSNLNNTVAWAFTPVLQFGGGIIGNSAAAGTLAEATSIWVSTPDHLGDISGLTANLSTGIHIGDQSGVALASGGTGAGLMMDNQSSNGYNGIITGIGPNKLGDLTLLGPYTVSGGSQNLPAAASWPGYAVTVTDSTTIAAEGQTCAHTGTSATHALAFSNGSLWKCF